MKRFLWAGGLALLIHGLLFYLGGDFFQKKTLRPLMHPLSFTLVTSPKETIKKPVQQNAKPVSDPRRTAGNLSPKKPLTMPAPKRKPELKPVRPSKIQKKPEPVIKTVPKKKKLKKKTVSPPEATFKEENKTSHAGSEQGAGVLNGKPGKVESQVPPLSRVIDAVPAYARNPVPPYPRIARKRRYEGTVFLEVLVSTKGRAKSLRVSISSGHQILDRAALKAVQKWLFEPGTVDGKPSEMWVRVPVRFELKGQ